MLLQPGSGLGHWVAIGSWFEWPSNNVEAHYEREKPWNSNRFSLTFTESMMHVFISCSASLKPYLLKGLSKWTRLLNDEAPVCQQFVLFLACWSHSCESFKYWSLLFCVLSYLDPLGESWGMHLANVAGQGGQKSCALTDDGCSNVVQDGSRRNKVFLFEKWCVNISRYCTLGQRRFIFANSSESSFSESGSLLNLTLLFIFQAKYVYVYTYAYALPLETSTSLAASADFYWPSATAWHLPVLVSVTW